MVVKTFIPMKQCWSFRLPGGWQGSYGGRLGSFEMIWSSCWSRGSSNVPVFPATTFVSRTFVQSEVEETLERIKVQPGVEGYVICDMEGQVKLNCILSNHSVAAEYCRCDGSNAFNGGSRKALNTKARLQQPKNF